MQFNGKIGIAIVVLLVFALVGLGFGSGFLIGRQFPAHRYERFAETRFLFDSATGQICDPLKEANRNPIDQARGVQAAQRS